MAEVLCVEETAGIAEIQREETLSSQDELAELLGEIDEAAQNHQLIISKEMVLRLLDLFSKRECLTDDERQFIREMITDLSDELKESKIAQAALGFILNVIGGGVGAIGSGFWDGAGSLGSMISGFGNVSDHMYGADQVWMEVGKQLRMNDMSQADGLNKTIHDAMDRVMQAVNTQDGTIQRARTR